MGIISKEMTPLSKYFKRSRNSFFPNKVVCALDERGMCLFTAKYFQILAGLQVLNMSMNNLKALQNNQVANAGLVNLQKFYLSLNQLRELQENAFYKMNNLVELDLSYNKLGAVPTNAFKHLGNLRQLLLKGSFCEYSSR